MMEFITISVSDHVAILSLNRPEKRNAIHGELVKALLHALQTIADDTRVRVLLIRGNGEHFCAGADIAWMQKIAGASYEDNYADALQLSEFFYRLYTFPKPTMVLAHGMTLGGGLGL